MVKGFSKIFEKINPVQIAFYLLAFYFSILMINATGFIINNAFIVRNSFIISLIIIGIIAFIADYGKNKTNQGFRYTLIHLALFAGIMLLLIFISVLLWDNSWDGQTYHLEAIHDIANGWNPVLFEKDSFISHYPKAFEKFGASVLQVTGDVETCKLSNLILLVASWLMSISVIKMLFPGKKRFRLFLITLLILNPIISSQLFTLLIDGQIAALFLVLLCSFLLWLNNVKFSFAAWLLSLSICIDLKFTGLVYAGLFFVFALAFLLFFKKNKVGIKRFIIANLLFLTCSVFFISHNPYFTNIKNGHHIFYPLMGVNAINIMIGTNAPASFEFKNRFEKFSIANLSKTSNVHGAKSAPEPRLKFPFSIDLKELTVFKSGSVLYGGFGPLFSGILVLSVIMVMYLFFHKANYRKEFLFLSAFLLVTVFIIPECWLARYVPQLWYFPVFLAIFIKSSGLRIKTLNFLNIIVLIVTALNAYMILGVSIISNLIITTQMRKEYLWLKNSNEKVILLPGPFISTTYRLDKYKINYTTINNEAGGKYNFYYEFHPILTTSTILVPSQVKPFEAEEYFKKLESYIKAK